MMKAFTYSQHSGRFCDSDGTLLGLGYAGNGAGINNPDAQQQHGHGPLPRGLYNIGTPHQSLTTGRFTMNLDPDPANQMFGRSLFRIHGDNPELDHTASDGCIVLDLNARQAIATLIAAGHSKVLEVIESDPIVLNASSELTMQDLIVRTILEDFEERGEIWKAFEGWQAQ